MTETSQRGVLARIFISPTEPRLRAGWRVVVQSLLMLAITIMLAIPLGLFMFIIPTLQSNLSWPSLARCATTHSQSRSF